MAISLDSFYDTGAYGSHTAAIQAAHDAAAAQKQPLVLTPSRTYTLDAGAIQARPGTTVAWQGNGATLKSAWGKPRCVDLVRTADYDTLCQLDMEDLTFDANGQPTGGVTQSVVGNLIDGGGINTQRVNARHVHLRNCTWVNVPVGGATPPTIACFHLASRHLAAGETQTSLVDVRLEGAVMQGGDFGACVMGTCPTSTGVEVYHDQLYLDVTHDPGVVPTQGHNGANVQVGSLGWGRSCEIHLDGANSGDVGVEIDGMERADVYGQISDAWNCCFFSRNFHAPARPAAQTNVYHGCVAVSVHLHGARRCVGFRAGNASILPSPMFGSMTLDECVYQGATPGTIPVWQDPAAAPINVSGPFTVL